MVDTSVDWVPGTQGFGWSLYADGMRVIESGYAPTRGLAQDCAEAALSRFVCAAPDSRGAFA